MTPVCRLLSREQFREAVFARDGNQCVVCGRKGKLDAHHIVDRKLWDDGGYYLENGVTLCDDGTTNSCHIKAEMTHLSCEELRARAGIKITYLPEQLTASEGEVYDKWGNQLLPSGARVKGELFNDDGCQRMLAAAGVLPEFLRYIKYPRSYHLPWSPNLQNDDRRIKNLNAFIGREVVVTEKLDGENTTLYPDYLHARSLDSKDHPSRSVVRQYHAAFKHEIPEGWRICMENVYARHSIPYTHLKAFAYVFNIWDETNTCLGWDEMVDYCGMLGVGVAPGFENGLPVVPVLWRGIWDEKTIQALSEQFSHDNIEGYVVRLTERIRYSEWRIKAAKYVRAAHVRTDEHWMRNWKPNSLAS